MSAAADEDHTRNDPSTARVAGLVCAVEGVALVGVVVFYLVELARGLASSVSSALGSAALVLIGAVGLLLLARGWFTRAPWPRTPTLVWHLLFVPVAISLGTSGQWGYAAVLAVVVIVGGGAALLAVDEDEAGDETLEREAREAGGSEDAGSDGVDPDDGGKTSS